MISLWTISRPPSSAVDSVMELKPGAIFDHGEIQNVLNFLPLRWIQGCFESRAWQAVEDIAGGPLYPLSFSGAAFQQPRKPSRSEFRP